MTTTAEERANNKAKRCDNFLLSALNGKTFKEIGNENGISAERARHLAGIAIRNIRFFCKDNSICFPDNKFYPTMPEMRRNKDFFIGILERLRFHH